MSAVAIEHERAMVERHRLLKVLSQEYLRIPGVRKRGGYNSPAGSQSAKTETGPLDCTVLYSQGYSTRRRTVYCTAQLPVPASVGGLRYLFGMGWPPSLVTESRNHTSNGPAKGNPRLKEKGLF